MMLKDGTEDGTGEVEDGTAKTGVVKNQDGRCLVDILASSYIATTSAKAGVVKNQDGRCLVRTCYSPELDY